MARLLPVDGSAPSRRRARPSALPVIEYCFDLRFHEIVLGEIVINHRLPTIHDFPLLIFPWHQDPPITAPALQYRCALLQHQLAAISSASLSGASVKSTKYAW